MLLLRENSAYTPNSQPRIPTQVCQGRVVTTDLPTLGTNPKRSRSGSMNQEAKDLAILRSAGQMVRKPGADGPQPTGRRSVNCNRTTRRARQHADGRYLFHGRSASNWCHADSLRRPGGLSTKHLPTKNNWPTGSKHRSSRTRGRSAPTTRTVRQVRTGAGTAA
jgi:hypothetical protein